MKQSRVNKADHQKTINTEERQRLETAFTRVSKSEDGQLVLRWLMEECGYKDVGVALDKDDRIIVDSTLFNLGRKDVWHVLRSSGLIPRRQLNMIEMEKI